MPSSVTVAFVPRETVSTTVECLRLLIERTPEVAYVAVVAGYPPDVAAAVRDLISAKGGRTIEFAGYASPNEARNAALAVADTRYIAFVDNDVTVGEDWLPPLVACAEETGAALVSPVVYELWPAFERIHIAGGQARLVPLPEGGYSYFERHHLAHKVATPPICRTRTELVEFHAVLVETSWLKSQGGLDEDLLGMAEHWDMSILAAAAGRELYLEPRSRVNYGPPRKLTPEDKRFFELRWSDEWFRSSLDALARKHGIPVGHASFDRLYGFLPYHRLHRHAELQGRIRQVLGRRLAKVIVQRLIRPVVAAVERPRLKRDLSEHRARRDAAARQRAGLS